MLLLLFANDTFEVFIVILHKIELFLHLIGPTSQVRLCLVVIFTEINEILQTLRSRITEHLL